MTVLSLNSVIADKKIITEFCSYHHIPIHPDYRHKTAIITNFETFEFFHANCATWISFRNSPPILDTSQALCDNVPVDAFSRISAIVTPSTIDYEFAQMKHGDDELKALLSATNQTLQLKQLRMPGSTTEIYCDISTGTIRPYIRASCSPTKRLSCSGQPLTSWNLFYYKANL
ncbi:hypothetical protein TNIN_300911 [Trichonephila inaurata madagascariensis]|uniref:Uncharacterized protein n=1 Tax=Trichonephila inaurata madagascariensis TaxID=2747483 RepID=A0A8X6YDK7_9ARAC|nr:hypothetical protein TNIN_300911 [Trichonephila inaurata madagascariensis]